MRKKVYVYMNDGSDHTVVGSYDDAAELAAAWAAERNGRSDGLVEWGDEIEGGVCPIDSTGEGWPWWRVDEGPGCGLEEDERSE